MTSFKHDIDSIEFDMEKLDSVVNSAVKKAADDENCTVKKTLKNPRPWFTRQNIAMGFVAVFAVLLLGINGFSTQNGFMHGENEQGANEVEIAAYSAEIPTNDIQEPVVQSRSVDPNEKLTSENTSDIPKEINGNDQTDMPKENETAYAGSDELVLVSYPLSGTEEIEKILAEHEIVYSIISKDGNSYIAINSKKMSHDEADIIFNYILDLVGENVFYITSSDDQIFNQESK